MSPLLTTIERKYPTLTKQDCERILRNLNAGLAILATNHRLPSIHELRAKSILTVLRNEIDEAARTVGAVASGGQVPA